MNTRNTTPFLRPEHVAPIRNLGLRAKLIVEGTMAGLHQSPYHGFSAEFMEYRSYYPGESTRFIDWRAYARSDRTNVRLYQDETNLRAHILLDKSASMGFASAGGMTKFDYGRTLAASLAWILVRQRDAVGVAAFDQDIRLFLPPRSTNIQLKHIIGHLDRMEAGGVTACGTAIDQVASRITRRGLCIVVSDLLDDPAVIIRGLRHLRFKRQDVIVLGTLDPLEAGFTSDRPLRIHDLESDAELPLDGQVAQEHFRQGITRHRAELARACADLSVDLEWIVTDEPFHHAITRALQKRRRFS